MKQRIPALPTLTLVILSLFPQTSHAQQISPGKNACEKYSNPGPPFYPTMPLEDAWSKSTVDWCDPHNQNVAQQEADLRFRCANTQTGLCFLCTNALRNRNYYSELNEEEAARSAGLSSDVKCVETRDQHCLPPLGGSAMCPELPTPGGPTGPNQPPSSFVPWPDPGPNGERVCRNDCDSEDNYVECVGGFRVCHTFRKCSDRSQEICGPNLCPPVFCGS